jgi:hypothetical protein
MPLSEKKEDLIAAGWVYDSDAFCKGCGEPIEFWITPRGKKAPMSVIAVQRDSLPFSPGKELLRRSHFATCANAEDFRK